MTRPGKIEARRFINARALLPCGAGPEGSAWKANEVASALVVSVRSIEHLKKRFVEKGLETAFARKKA
jgi:hypothetical protein